MNIWTNHWSDGSRPPEAALQVPASQFVPNVAPNTGPQLPQLMSKEPVLAVSALYEMPSQVSERSLRRPVSFKAPPLAGMLELSTLKEPVAVCPANGPEAPPFNQEMYLELVRLHLRRLGHTAWDEETEKASLRWALARASRSGRVAQQFARGWAGHAD